MRADSVKTCGCVERVGEDFHVARAMKGLKQNKWSRKKGVRPL